MGASDLAELAVEVGASLETAWVLFLSINSTIIGGIILIQRTFSKLEKSVAIVIYLVISWMNYMSISSGIRLLASIHSDISKFQFGPSEPGHDVILVMTDHSTFLWSNLWIIPTFYIGAGILTIGAIILDEKITKIAKRVE